MDVKYSIFDEVLRPLYKNLPERTQPDLIAGVEGSGGGGEISEIMQMHARKIAQAENDLIEKKLEEALVRGLDCGVTVKRRFLKHELTDEGARSDVFIFVDIDPEVPFGHIHYETEY